MGLSEFFVKSFDSVDGSLVRSVGGHWYLNVDIGARVVIRVGIHG